MTMILEHGVAIASAVTALLWLVRRAVRDAAGGACGGCAASSCSRERPAREPEAVLIEASALVRKRPRGAA